MTEQVNLMMTAPVEQEKAKKPEYACRKRHHFRAHGLLIHTDN